MKARELLNKIASTGYSMATMQELFSMAECNSEKADEVARIIDETNSEEEILIRIEEVLKARGKNYFCREAILAVHIGKPKDVLNYECGYFLDCYQENITMYLSKGYRIIFETWNYAVSVECDGVFLHKKYGNIQPMQKDGEILEEILQKTDPFYFPTISLEHSLFAGREIHCVKKTDLGYELVFDDFSILVCSENNIGVFYRWLDNGENHRLHGFERLLEQKCTCGGNGIAYIDLNRDYFVKCDKCSKQITKNKISLGRAIEAWNDMIYAEDYEAESEEQY